MLISFMDIQGRSIEGGFVLTGGGFSTLTTLSGPAILAQGQPSDGGLLGPNLFLIVIIFAIIYFLLIRPAQRQRKKHQTMLDGLKNGDRVVTNGGLIGTVTGVKDSVVQLRLGDNVRVEILKSYIAGHQPGEDEASKD